MGRDTKSPFCLRPQLTERLVASSENVLRGIETREAKQAHITCWFWESGNRLMPDMDLSPALLRKRILSENMAGEVTPQGEGSRSSSSATITDQWQIVTCK